MAKQLNFFPIYEGLLREAWKTVSIRLGDKRNQFKAGDEVWLTVGWSEEHAVKVCKAKITDVRYCQIKELTAYDLIGESLDCSTPQLIPYVLGAIYRQVVTPEDYVTLIRWRYL